MIHIATSTQLLDCISTYIVCELVIDGNATFCVIFKVISNNQILVYFVWIKQKKCIVFSSPCQRQCELLPSLGIRPSLSVNKSYFNLLLQNHWTNMNQTWQEWFLGGPLSELHPRGPPSIQDGHLIKIGNILNA